MAIAAAAFCLLCASVAHAQTPPTTPTVSTIAVTSNPGTDNTYATGDKIEVTVTFSEAVTVSTTDGTPRLAIDIGGQPRNIPYDRAGSSTGQLIFGYTAFAGDMDADGIAVKADGLALNGGTIRSTDDSTDADLGLSAQTFTTHKVDTVVTLVSNIGQADAADTITISATESAEATIRIPATDNGFDLTGIVLDVSTASDTLDVTINVEPVGVNVAEVALAHNFTFTGSAASAGSQVFSLSDPFHRRANMSFAALESGPGYFPFRISIGGSGEGAVEIGATTSSAEDTGGQNGFSIGNPASGATVPRFNLAGHTAAVPYIYHADVISEPADGASYKAGEHINVLFLVSRFSQDKGPTAEAGLWLGDGAEHYRAAQRVGSHEFGGLHALIYSYEVQAGDADADGILLAENSLGRNENIDLVDGHSNVPVDLSMPAAQQGTGQSVQGSQAQTCQDIWCATLVVEDGFPDSYTFIFEDGEYVDSIAAIPVQYDLVEHPAGYRPLEYSGSVSQSTFTLGGTDFAISKIAHWDGVSNAPTTPEGPLEILRIYLEPEMPHELADRLAFAAGNSMLPLREADIGDYYPLTVFTWRDPGLEWNDGDVLQIKLIELPVTASFDAAAYGSDEGGSVDVTVTLGDYFEKTVTLPLTATGAGGATSADFSGVPSELVFAPGETEKTFTVELTDDDVDDDDESVTLSFGTLPSTVKTGGDHETATVAIRDDDDPEVDVEFGAATYSADEGGTATVTVTLSADPERTVIIPLTATGQGGVSTADYSGVPASVTFNTGETSKTFTFRAAQDDVDDDDESVKLIFGTLPDRVSEGTQDETTVSIRDDDDPYVDVQFGAATYSADEGGTATVTVTLSADPERTVTIPLITTEQGGATSADFSVPSDVTFNTGQTSRAFTFSAAQDDVDDDDESVKLTFGTLPPRVSEGAQDQTTVSIDDDDDPFVSVSYEHTEYQVFEGGSVTLALVLSVDPERTVIIPLTAAGQSGATSMDYSAPASVTFNSGETRKTFRFTATEDTVQEDSESVRLGFASALPSRVDPGSPSEATVAIRDCEGGGIWCASLELSLIYGGDHGRTRLRRANLDYDQFLYNGVTYAVGGVRVYSYEQRLPVTPPFAIPERASISLDLSNLNGTGFDRYQVPNEDYLDWTLHISTTSNGETLTAELPFSEAKKFGTPIWRWYGLDIDKLRLAWTTGKVYKLRIVEDFRSERTARVLGPPLYLRVQEEYSNSKYLRLRWVAPQMRDDYLPPEVSYKIQWKESTGSWDTAADVSEATRGASTKHSVTYGLGGLDAGVEYNIRVIATNSVGDSEPSNEITLTKPGEGQPHAVNSPATGGPGIDGSLRAGETLTASTSGIADEDGMSGAVFAYQWIRRDLATVTDTDIPGATGSTYTVTTGDEGKALMVRVTFSDDAGNEESLTSFAVIISPPLVIPDDEPANTPATGSPGIDGSPVVGQTLTATTSDIGDDDGIVDAAFAYQWLAGDEAIEGASASTYTVAAGDVGKTIKVRVAFTDDVGNEESLTSAPTAAVKQALTASVHSTPASHDGSASFTFELRFSETPREDFSYVTLRDHAFAVTGGEVTNARRLEPGKNVRWEITVQPSGDADVTLSLPVTTDCASQGAICTGDGRMLSAEVEVTVSGPGSQPSSQENSAATGAPTISGTAQVGDSLTADTSGIADADGLTSATFAYRWLADDAEISGATGSSYTLTSSEQGKTIKVRVAFTDDAGNAESLTSDATAAVAARPNSAATGAPTISGTAQVGKTLTAATIGHSRRLTESDQRNLRLPVARRRR